MKAREIINWLKEYDKPEQSTHKFEVKIEHGKLIVYSIEIIDELKVE